jgi:hypothetical protein
VKLLSPREILITFEINNNNDKNLTLYQIEIKSDWKVDIKCNKRHMASTSFTSVLSSHAQSAYAIVTMKTNEITMYPLSLQMNNTIPFAMCIYISSFSQGVLTMTKSNFIILPSSGFITLLEYVVNNGAVYMKTLGAYKIADYGDALIMGYHSPSKTVYMSKNFIF